MSVDTFKCLLLQFICCIGDIDPTNKQTNQNGFDPDLVYVN